MQALSDLRGIRCSTFHVNEGKIRRQHGARPGSAFTSLSRRLGEPSVPSLGLVLQQADGIGFQHPPGRLWTKFSASEDDSIVITEAADPLEEVAAPEPLPVEELEGTEPTVKVKFVLQKECYFGQQYNVVGDNTYLGNWEPTASVPLVWSEDHVWSAEVEVPAGRAVEYKFLLTGKRGELEWQPGPNKWFEAGENEPTLVVSGKWDTEVVTETQTSEGEAGEEAQSGEEAEIGDEKEAAPYIVSETGESVVEASKSGEGNGQLLGGTAPEVPLVEFGVAQAAAEVSEEVVKQLEEAAAPE